MKGSMKKNRMTRGVISLCMLVLASIMGISSLATADVGLDGLDNIEVKGLFKNGAILVINGKQRMLKAGKTSPEGVQLVSASSQEALVKINGKTFKLNLSKQIGGQYKAAEKTEVRIPRGMGGHYYVTGKINGRTTQFLVDTGATTIGMSSKTAKALNIDYSQGKPTQTMTASGVAQGYIVALRSVAVGDIRLNNVDAVIIEGAYPAQILLGNSYLGRVNMKVESGVMVLQSKY